LFYHDTSDNVLVREQCHCAVNMNYLTRLLVLALLVSSAFVYVAADEPTETVTSQTEPPTEKPAIPLKTTPEAYPYGKPKIAEGAVKLSEYQSLAIPSSVLLLIFVVFISGLGYIVYLIFDSVGAKERKKLEKQKAKEEKKVKKTSKKAD